MEFTSASANKYLRRLQDEKDRLLRTEQEVSTYVLAEGEAAELIIAAFSVRDSASHRCACPLSVGVRR